MQLNEYLNHTDGPPDLQRLIQHVAAAGQQIAALIRQGGLAGVTEKLSSINVQGETQMQLDLQSHTLALAALQASGVVAGVLSEETAEPVQFDTPDAPYLVCMDPLDGSSNLAINGVVGSIFSVLPNIGLSSLGEQAFLQAGQAQRAAAYIMYGPATLLVLSLGQGTHVFTLDPDTQTFKLTQQALQLSADTSEFAINASRQAHWPPAVQRYIAECLQGEHGPRQRAFNMRWCASMVMDVHRILTRGGIFLYPREPGATAAGRLRLLYEANPMAWLVTQAGGLAISGAQDVLAVLPESGHQRIGVMLGARHEIERLRSYELASQASIGA